MVRRWTVALGLSGLLCSRASLSAQDEDAEQATPQANDAATMEGAQERARLHFQAGASYYEAGSYEDALREFRHAYEMSGRPQLLYNLSLCYQNLGRLEEAIAHLRRFLDEVEEVPNRANLEIRIQNFQRRLEEERAQAEAQAAAEAEAEHDSQPTQREPDEPDEPDEPIPAEGGGGPNVGAIIGFSAGGAGVLMAGIFGGLTLAEDGRLSDECSPGCAEDDVSTLKAFALLTDIGFGLAIAGAAAGVILLLVDGGGDSGEQQAAVAPWLDREGGGLAVSASF